MQNLILSANVVLPLFLMMALGYMLRQIHLFTQQSLKECNNLVFRVFLPIMLFMNVYQTDLSGVWNPRLMAFAVLSILVLYALTFGAVLLLEKDNRRRGVLIQGIYRSNFVLFGLPVTTALFGESSAGVASILIAVVVPIYNVLAVVTLELFRGGKIHLKKALKGIATNPLILSALLGLLCLILRVSLPTFLEKTLTDLSRVATPLALVVLGGSFQFSRIRGNSRQIFIGTVGRLVVLPALGLGAGILMGFRGPELSALLAMFASPAAVSSFTMAQQMDADSELAGQLVVFGSTFSILTVFLWIFLLKQGSFF